MSNILIVSLLCMYLFVCRWLNVSSFSSSSFAHVKFSLGEFSEKLSLANVSTSKVYFIFSTCFLTNISIFEEIALFSRVKCIKIGTTNPSLGMGGILGVVLATVPVTEPPSWMK